MCPLAALQILSVVCAIWIWSDSVWFLNISHSRGTFCCGDRHLFWSCVSAWPSSLQLSQTVPSPASEFPRVRVPYLHSAGFLRGSLHSSQKFSLHAALSSLVLYSADLRYLDLLHFQLCVFSRALFTQGVHWALPRFPIPVPWSGNSHGLWAGVIRGLTLSISQLPGSLSFIVWCPLPWKLLIDTFHLVFLIVSGGSLVSVTPCLSEAEDANEPVFTFFLQTCMHVAMILHCIVFNSYLVKQNWS